MPAGRSAGFGDRGRETGRRTSTGSRRSSPAARRGSGPTAALLGDRGARVAALDLNPSGGPDECLRITADTTDDTVVRAAVRRVADELGGLDVLVKSAGIGATGDITANDETEWRRLFDVNALGAARVTRAALPPLRGSAHPSVVNVSLAVAIVGVPNRALYSATKGALLSLTLAMAAAMCAKDSRERVAPGTADTPWVAGLVEAPDDPAAELGALEARQPIGRLVGAEEVATRSRTWPAPCPARRPARCWAWTAGGPAVPSVTLG